MKFSLKTRSLPKPLLCLALLPLPNVATLTQTCISASDIVMCLEEADPSLVHVDYSDFCSL